MKEDNNGYIVVETLGSFMLFLFLISSILSLVNIVTLQARVHYAITQTAQTISMYSYVLHITSTDTVLSNVDKNASEAKANVNDFKSEVGAFIDGLENMDPGAVNTAGSALAGRAEDIVDDPHAMISSILNLGIDAGVDAGTQALVQTMTGRYLTNGAQSGEEYLQSVGVIGGLSGLNFAPPESASTNLIDKRGNLTIAVQYDVEYTFGGLPLPFEPKLTITQGVKTKLWLGGS